MDGNLARSLAIFLIGLIMTLMGYGVFGAKYATGPKNKRLQWLGPAAMVLSIVLYFLRKR